MLPRRQIGCDGRRQASGHHLRSSKHRRPRRSSRPRCPRACALRLLEDRETQLRALRQALSELRSASLGGDQLRLLAKQRPPLLLVDVAHPAARIDVRPVVSGLIGPGREGES
ncbi:type II toxin-antitoxin system ParD family antitoxin, partial [Bacillus subtilis]